LEFASQGTGQQSPGDDQRDDHTRTPPVLSEQTEQVPKMRETVAFRQPIDALPSKQQTGFVHVVLIHRSNHDELTYKGGQDPIGHQEFDLHKVVAWAEEEDRRWAFTLSNTGAYYFKDRSDLTQLAD